MKKSTKYEEISCKGLNDKGIEKFLSKLFQKKIVRVEPPEEYRHCFDVNDARPGEKRSTTLVTEEFSDFTIEFEGGVVLKIGTYREELKLELSTKRQPSLL